MEGSRTKTRMKLLTLQFVIVGLCGFCLQCSTSNSDDVAHAGNATPAQASSESLDIDSEWRIKVTHLNSDPRTRLTASCSTKGDCWYWSSSELIAGAVDNVREISVRRQQNENILDASAVSKDAGWIVTSAGLFKISNFGADWTSVAVSGFGPKQGSIHAVHFSDDQHGWVAGGIYRPLADGEGAPNNALSDDRQQVLVGAIARTTDGGLSWEMKRFDQAKGRFVDIVSYQRVVLVSGDAGLESTDDGGDTWKDVLADLNRRERPDRLEVIGTFVLDERRCWVTVSGADFLTTSDELKTWQRFSPSAELNAEVPPFDELAFVDDRRGLAVYTTEGGSGRLYKTNDGGRTWTHVKLDQKISGLAVVPGTTQIMAAGEGKIYSFSPI